MFDPKVIFITGASSGIGWATALEFARRGHLVVGTARSLNKLRALEEACEALDGEFHAVKADVRDRKQMRAAVDEALGVFDTIDVLVANAGVGFRGSLIDADWQSLETLMRTNMDGVVHSIRAVVPVMRDAGGGHIVTVSSITGAMPVPYAVIYGASKAFVSNLARSLRYELAPDNIYVTDMLVGRTDSSFNEHRLGEGAQQKRTGVPVMPPETVATAIADAVLVRRRRTVILRWFDRLAMWASAILPDFVARRAMRQYR